MPAVVPRPYADCQRLYHAELARLAQEAFDLYCANPYQELFLYGSTRSGNYAQGFYDLHCAADGDEIVISEHIPRHLPINALAGWFKDQTRNTPMWCFCD